MKVAWSLKRPRHWCVRGSSASAALRHRLSLSHLSQPPKMRGDACEEGLVRVVLNPEFPARFLNQLADARVVDVTDAREQVVLNLEIQPAEEPAQHRVPPREVDGRLHLVDGPVGF